MRTIKLDAIDSTNEFLKRSIKDGFAQDNDAVFAVKQTDGKGQMGAKWSSEASKNLTGSVLIKFSRTNSVDFFKFNAAVCLAVRKTILEFCDNSGITIKWPNDIMAENKKIAGILIENVFSGDNDIWTIVGVGINVNQQDFENLPNATSLEIISEKNFIIDEIFELLSQNIIAASQFSDDENIWENYHSNLFRMNAISKFAYARDSPYLEGEIVGVSENGKLMVMANGEILEFANKEISLIL